MSNEMPKNAENRGVYKTQDFESYALWKSLPSFLRGQPRQALEKLGIDAGNELKQRAGADFFAEL